ncbi:hypothetical protein LVD17_04550 [Fulvivirga ulvae]|uniref:spermine/spermidine synthase domain-containing protein n=1 Tax=Fulvivirga ulvae TaxID=2904245 RepID=UPI001F251DBA|nr:hypothetical protein [Fulvivirga ulvae]UII33096.1 hypothetical protein LVD17_04550 [Fulvivirga ulvae]
MTFLSICRHAYYLLGAILLGTALRLQIDLLNYFYETRFADWVPVFIVFISAFMLAIKYIDFKGATSLTANLLFLTLVLFGAGIVFRIYGYMDWANIVVYMMLSILAVVLGIFLKPNRYRVNILIILASSLAFWIAPALSTQWLTIPVAILYLFHEALYRQWWKSGVWVTASLVLMLVSLNIPGDNIRYKSQKKYYDKVLYSSKTPYHQIDITTWKGHEWFYYDNINQFSSIDYSLYFEPMVHPVMKMSPEPKRVLVIGAENGLLIREVLKHPIVEQVDLVPMDTALLNIAATLNWFTDLNHHSLKSGKLQIRNDDIFHLLDADSAQYDLIFVDVPDPVDIEFSRYYTLEFYELCHRALKTDGMMVTQAGSPYLATIAFYTIQNTIKAASFATLPLHNQVLTIGEWGWVIGAKGTSDAELLRQASQCTFDDVDTRWLNHEAMQMILSFGKPSVSIDSLDVNTLKQSIIHEYYKSGTWTF